MGYDDYLLLSGLALRKNPTRILAGRPGMALSATGVCSHGVCWLSLCMQLYLSPKVYIGRFAKELLLVPFLVIIVGGSDRFRGPGGGVYSTRDKHGAGESMHVEPNDEDPCIP